MSRNGRQGARGERGLIAAAAARLIAEEGVTSYRVARDKALRRLGIERGRDLPTPREIEAALVEHQRLFAGAAHADRVAALRRQAAEAMRVLADFSPRLVGRVLAGTAGEHARVTLHLFTDTAEEVGLFLFERAIPHRLGERRYRFGERDLRVYPTCSFLAGDTEVELVVFPAVELRQAPPSPLDGRPMPRASLAEVESLLAGRALAPGP
ncbi:MAG: hypothetical protein IT495_04065 [Gammaproteobacteria bacterium]|nr:hypothetical protein [Gammaproteobacteria bacterium]